MLGVLRMSSKDRPDRQIPKWFSSFVPEEVSDSSIFRFEITIAGKTKEDARTITVDMRADLGIDYTAIQQQLEDTPSEFAYWAAIYSEVKMYVSQLERQVKARRGKIAQILVEEATKNSIKLTDKQLASAIEGDDKLNELEGWLIKMQKQAGKLFFMVDAIRMKCDNLRSLAGFARAEYQNAKS
jgi:hypothetical protein